MPDEIYKYAIQLLARRDHSTAELRIRLEARFGVLPEDFINQLASRKFLDDRRFAENYVRRRERRGPLRLREELLARGVAQSIIDEVLASIEKLSLQDVLKAKMQDWKLRPPVTSREAARLFRHLRSLGYDEDAIRVEIEKVHDQ